METSKAQEECDKAIQLNSSYGDIYVQMSKVQWLPWQQIVSLQNRLRC